jgi:YD repeat-containing protein
LAYTLEWEYDGHGNVISEKDAAGNVTVRKFDSNDNLLYEHKADTAPRVLVYDRMNRLISETQNDQQGQSLQKRYSYDAMGNCTGSIDIDGSQTLRVYDGHGRLLKTSCQGRGAAALVAKRTYKRNGMGLATEIVDGRGNATQIEYNIRGKPTLIIHPDGKTERYLYTLWGDLAEETKRDGLKVCYRYDAQGREVKREWVDKAGAVIKVTRKSYNAFHLLSESDGMGNKTSYSYDSAGRLVSKKVGKRTTLYSYDSLGRCTATRHLLADGTAVSHIERYDLLDRLVESHTEDASGEISSRITKSYDAQGNEVEQVSYGDAGKSVTAKRYDLFGREVWSKNGLGEVTRTSYQMDEAERRQVVTDPRGVKRVTIYDPLDRVTVEACFDPYGKLVDQTEYRYDRNGNRIVRRIKTDKGVVTTRWQYDSLNRLTMTIEAAESGDQKCTGREYTASGYLKKLIKNDGTTLTYSYDQQGRRIRVKSSDGTISHTFAYDGNGNRTSDGENSYQYDALGRLTDVKTPLGNYRYFYDPLGRRVARISEEAKAKESFLWQQQQEVGRIDSSGKIAELRILNDRSQSVAFELNGELFVPIQDQFGHTRALIDSHGQCIATYRYSAYGDEQVDGQLLAPWRYAGKRFDNETGLIYFGEHYYDL